MELTWTKAIIGGFALATAVAAGTWNLRADRIEELESRIEFYEKTDEWKLPSLLKSLDNANKSIQSNIKSLADYESVKKENERLKNVIIEGEKKLASLQEQLDESKRVQERVNRDLLDKEEFIRSLYPHNETFTLEENTRKDLLGSQLILGLANVSPEYVKVIYNNNERKLFPGNYIEYKVEDSSCKVVLDAIHWPGSPNKATFSFFCLGKSNKKIQPTTKGGG